MPPIQSDGATTITPGVELTEQDAANAFLNLFADEVDDDASKKKPSDKGDESNASDKEDDAETEGAEEEQTDDDGETETSEDDESPSEEEEETADEKPKDKKYADSDDIYVKVKVGDEEHEVPVKDLKRLFGQEAALTRKSQEVAAKAKEAETHQARSAAALEVLVKRAQEAANPYRNINWAALMKDPNVSAEEVQSLQQIAQAAFDNEKFLTTQLDGFMQAVQQEQQQAQQKSAADCIKALTTEDSPTYIKGFNTALYNDIRAFGVEMGLHKDMVNNLTDPAAFKLMNMAMQFHRGSAKVVTTKVNKAPKKITKSSTAKGNVNNSQTARTVDRNKAVAKLRKSGSQEDAVSAFETMFKGYE